MLARPDGRVRGPPYDGAVTITAAADGSALGNPGPSGWAWYIDDDNWAAGGWKHGTNNMGELKAVLELFRATAHTGEDLLVLCDSQYVINSITKWMPGWKRKGWKKGDGKPVMNVDLMKEIDEALRGRTYRFEWVKGHAGHGLNEAADVRARAAAEAYQRGREVPAGPGFGGAGSTAASVTPAGDDATATPTPGAGVESRIAEEKAGPAAPVAPKVERPLSTETSLFDFDDIPDPVHEVVLQLTDEEHRRLVQRARAEGVSPEDLLRRLI